MNLRVGILFFLFFFASLQAMKNDEGAATKKSPVTSYLQLLPSDLLNYLFSFFSQLSQVPDNRGDVIIQTHAQAREVATMFARICNVDVALSKTANKGFLLASESFVKENDPEGYSFFVSNQIGLACALGTEGALEALKQEIGNQMETFKDLSQETKNKLLLDVMRRLPSKTLIQKMLENGAQVNCKDAKSGFTPLRYAVEEVKVVKKKIDGKEQMVKRARMGLVKLILNSGGNPDVADRCSTTPLQRGCMLGNEELVRLIAQKTPTINALNAFGHNALSYAAGTGNPVLVGILLDKGARTIFADRSQERNVFVSAVESNSPQVLQILLDVRDPAATTPLLNQYLNVALKRAAELGRGRMIPQLLKVTDTILAPDGQMINLIPDFLINNESAITASVMYDNLAITKHLLTFAKERYPKQNYEKARSFALALTVYKLHQSVQAKEAQKVEQLNDILDFLLNDDNPDPLGKQLSHSSCFVAARNQDLPLLTRLLKHAQEKRKIENGSIIALQESIERLNPEAVHTVLATKPDINQSDGIGKTIFFQAVSLITNETLKIIDDLFAAGADASKCTVTKLTPAHALMANHDEKSRLYILDALHARGISIDAADIDGDTPLHLACSREPFMISTVAKLLEYKAGPNRRNKHGNTPLIHAAGLGSEELVTILLTAGANPNIANNSGCGAFTKAAGHGSKKIIDSLTAAGGKIKPFLDAMLRAAAKENHVSLMEELLKMGAKMDGESSSWGNTPLHKAVNGKSGEAVLLLLEHGANKQAKNRQGNTALELSVSCGNPAITELLLEYNS